MTTLLWSCKKDASLEDADIKISGAYVTWIQPDQVDLSFRLSRLGYQETGLSYYPKNKPDQVFEVKAVRENEALNLSLQNLLPSTEYIYQFFVVEKGNRKTDKKLYSVTTLSAKASQYNLNVAASQIYYNQQGHFNFEIDAENLQDLNLADLIVTVNDRPVKVNYPQLSADKRYKMKLEGSFDVSQYTSANVKATYKGILILSKYTTLTFDGERYWFSYEKTGMRPMMPTIFKNDLYYFYDNGVHKWDEVGQRLEVVGIKENVGLMDYTVGTGFDDQIFFPALFSYKFTDPKTSSGHYNFTVVHTYNPVLKLWKTVPFKGSTTWTDSRNPESNRYFTHKNKFYLSYSSVSTATGAPGHSQKRELNLYEYDTTTNSFGDMIDLKIDMVNPYFFSTNNQMYLMGWVALKDQDFVVGATLAVYKVSETDFSLEKIFIGGTVNVPMDDLGLQFITHNGGVVIYTLNKNMYFFDPVKVELSKVNFRNFSVEANLYGLFNYNNNLYGYGYFDADQQRVYKLSITKGR